ncbi:hypothetical protein CVT26_013315 [Gymnopilus dilepis]|uniref:DUF202 domain-containing protein n=1 Tax=Gymnopilus dilepis TaxID=231916 RepID=A0A409VUT8_9AGAR|nr:hypothetical protein CVT26_013315 [Gymnopilus dilepis]
MSNLLQNVFSPNRRQEQEADALSEFRSQELERGGRSTSQFNETPFPSPVESPTASSSSSRPSGVDSPRTRRRLSGEQNITLSPGFNPPATSPTSARPPIELTGRDVMHDVSNALEVVAAEKEEQTQRPKSISQPALTNGVGLPQNEAPYTANALSSSVVVPSSPVCSEKHPKRSKKLRHPFGAPFKALKLPGLPLSSERKSRLGKFNPSLVLENSGSVARDHLASERTFLAYVRTSLALTSMGVAIVQLFTIADLTSKGSNSQAATASQKVQKFARPLGVTTVVLALLVLVIGKSFPSILHASV